LDCGVNVGAVDKRGYTPLHLVARTANEKVMILLLDADAPVNAKSKEKFQVTKLS
jgi:ankyrin repeat protein